MHNTVKLLYDTVMNTGSMTLPAVYHTSFTLMHQTSECQ
jgi:hypothetical protein